MNAGNRPPRAIDFHAHIMIPEVYAVTAKHSLIALPLDGAAPQTDEVRRANADRRKLMDHQASDVTERVELMDQMGVAIQVLTVSGVHQATDMLPIEESLRLERMKNDRMSQIVKANPTRYVGFGSLPLQEPKLAVAELERCRGELGLRGVQIATFYAGRELGHPDLDPFWAKAEELDAAVYIHPSGNRDPRFRLHFQWNSIGQSFEEAMAIASLMYEGVLDRYPKLKITVSHGGGYMPFNYARFTRNWLEKPSTRVRMKEPPAEFLKRLTYDSCVYDQRLLEQLVGVVGEDRVVLGSDYPVGDRTPVAFIEGCKLSREAKDKILWRNASAMLGIGLPQ
jgi:aminocarboxymuconate-semialdehyde decarboxylase